jgi:alanine racemase
MRPITARIHRTALRHNLGVVRKHAARSRVWAVIKADAYGHGLKRAARALEDADGLALLELESALELRAAGERRPILLLEGCFSARELPKIAEEDLTTVVHSLEQVGMLEKTRLDARVSVYLKVNTGMNRLGLEPAEFRAALARLQACRSVAQITLMTHFADTEGGSRMRDQCRIFDAAAAAAGARLPRSLANSAAILRCPEAHGDWVRPGIMLYGCSPFSDASAESLGLKPAMTLASEIIAVRELAPGTSIGYGWTFTAPAPMRVGVVACGYADGYPRHAPTGTPIVVAGKRTRTIGTVSMDMLFADLTGIPNAAVGSTVMLWGEHVSADEVAASAGTVSYELLCGLGQRVPVTEI